TPKTEMERLFRDSVLELAARHEFARKLVNSGRLSRPCELSAFGLQTPAEESATRPGSAMPDAPVGDGAWLLNHVGGRFTVLAIDTDLPKLPEGAIGVRISTDSSGCDGGSTLHDARGMAAARYGTGNLYLIRPDQHIAA